ncbi:MAG TPA: GWxTD domain-containing protein [Candidatus Polarisedimenticolia bacterium]|nr:GWxTD domain-containing protein [Candidatus Polarisedimenticolia bacterium]
MAEPYEWFRARRLALAGALLLAQGVSFGAADPWDTADAKWHQGPAKYLLTKEEIQAYRKLKQPEERSRFVQEFWTRRDPSPGTPDNEFRDEFYRRAREAASELTEDDGKGWQDDRGRVYILLGKPDEKTTGTGLLESSSAGFGSAPGGFGSDSGGSAPPPPTRTCKFVYLNNPLTGASERLELNFTGDVTGGFRLDEKIDWNHPVLRGLTVAARRAAPPAAGQAQAPAPAAPETAPPSSPPAPEAPPAERTPQMELMEQVRAAAEAPSAIPLDVTMNYYKAADNSTFATLTLEVKRAALAAAADPTGLLIAAEILNAQTGESEQRFFRPEHFGAFDGNLSAGINDTLLYQAERPLKPGSYKAVFALKDPASGQTGTLEREIQVPSFEGDSLGLSSVTLVRKIEPLSAPPGDETPAPFVLGKFKVVPRPDNVYKDGEEIAFYYQIYGAAPDELTKLPKVDLSYAFEKSDTAGAWRMVGGRPVLTGGQSALVQAYSLPIRGWPAGDYRISVKITDTVSGRTAEATLPFKVQAAAGAKAKSKGKG